MVDCVSELIFVVHSKSDPKGTALGTLTEAYDKSLGLEDNAIGNGAFALHPDSSEIGLVTQGNYVKAYRDSVTVANRLGGFWIEYGGDRLLNEEEGGGQEWQRGGRGPIAILEEALVWHRAVSGGSTPVERSKNRWLFKGAHPARVLVRLLEEAKARGALPGVTWDFTRTRDSDGNKFSSDNFDKFAVPIGVNLLDVVAMLRDNDLHVVMDANLKLHAWDEYENDLSGSIDIEEGINIRDSGERQVAARTAKSHVLMKGTNEKENDIYRAVANSTIKTQLGRRKEGYFEYPRTATKAILKRVGARKLRKWKKRHDGVFTLGIIDTSGQVAGVNFTVGDEVNVNIPGAYNNQTERIVGILFSERPTGEYDVSCDFGEFGHDPFTGQYMGGDSEGVTPCGCKGSKPGTGLGGGGGDKPDGVPGTTPVQHGTFDLDDFNRDGTSAMPFGHLSGISEPLDPIDDLSGWTGHRHLHEMPLPDGARAVGDVVGMFASLTAQHDGAADNITYSPVVGRAPRVVAVKYTTQTDVYADELDIPLPDGIRAGLTLFVHLVMLSETGTFGNYYDWSGAGWTGDWGWSNTVGTPDMRECVPVLQVVGDEGFEGVNDSVNLGDVSAATHTIIDKAITFAFLVEGAVDLGDALGADDEVGWNGSWGSDTGGNESFDPTSGYWNWGTNDLTLYMAVGFADAVFTGDFVNLDTVKDDTFTDAGWSGHTAQLKWALTYEKSNTFATGGGLSYNLTEFYYTRVFALRGGPAWTGFEGHTSISHAPSMHRYKIIAAGDLEPGGLEGGEDVVNVWFDDVGGTFNDLEPNIGYDTLALDGPADYAEGSDTLFGGTNQLTFNDMVGPSPDNGDFLFFGFATKGGVGAEWVDGDIGSVTGGVISNVPLAGFQVLSLQPTYDETYGLAAKVLVALRSESNQFEYTFADRYGPVTSLNASDEDAGTISTGATGGGIAMTSGLVEGGDGSGIGNILTSGQNGGSPWTGGNPWTHQTGDPGGLDAFGVDGSSLFAEGNGGGTGDNWATFAVTEDQRALPFSGEDWDIEIRYRVSGVIPNGTSNNHLLVTWQYPYMSAIFLFKPSGEGLRIGSGVSGAVSTELSKVLAGGNSTGSEAWGRIRWQKDGATQRAKEWADASAEPAAWDVTNIIQESALDEALETYDSLGEFDISLIVGNVGGTAMRLEVDWVRVTTFPSAGETVVNSFVAYGDNSTVKFFVKPFRAGTLRVWVDSFPVVPVETDADAGWFRLDKAPYGDPSDDEGSAQVRASYEAAS